MDELLCSNRRAGLDEMINPPPLIRKQQSQADLEKKKQQLKTVLEKSLTKERLLRWMLYQNVIQLKNV